MSTTPDVRVRRVYAEPEPSDGHRVLVDRLWPRGISKQRAELFAWRKDVAPSTDLRKWYAHDPTKFEEFAARYREELSDSDRAAALDDLQTLAGKGTLTLLTAAKRADISEATVLQAILTGSSATSESESGSGQ
ncbi:DUF488 family protein [Gordonia sp. CPCC 206044]|uniref:DUF488 domain-containing protein n=1 Tax=Gordonia sp. CPCC 206044 TaxID=3140793 RepID=UPI003AF394FE